MDQSKKRNSNRWPRLLAGKLVLGTLALGNLALGAGPAGAQEAPVALAFHCSGCTEREKAARASNAGDDLTVYVFDHETKQVSKFWIEATVVEESPYTVNKRVLAREPEADLAAAFAELVDSWDTMIESLPLNTPASSEVHSVAKALHGPGYLLGSLQIWVENDPEFFPPSRALEGLSTAWMTHGLAWPLLEAVVLNFTPMVRNLSVPLQFSDGSRANFNLSIDFNLLSQRHSWRVSDLREFKLTDGRRAPTGPNGWSGFEITETGAALAEWLRYARYSDDVELRGWNGEPPDHGTLRCSEARPIVCQLDPL